MSTEIYLRIVKDVDPSDDPTYATLIAKLMSPIPLPGVICGDSLDMPFIKWIKLTGFNNSIGFSSGTVRQIDDQGKLVEQSYGTGAGSYADARKPTSKVTYGQVSNEVLAYHFNDERGEYDPIHGAKQTQAGTLKTRAGGTQAISRQRATKDAAWGEWSQSPREKKRGATWRARMSSFNKNDFLKISLPDHGGVTFTKQVDNSTPQLAYACSCQESIGTVMVLFRRRIGLGVRGIRVPFMAIMMSKCLVTAWELDGEAETVSMSYQEIRWCTYDQMADFNIATGMSARKWDTADGKGGESLAMYAILGGIAAAAMAGALTDTIASATTADSVSGTGSTDRGDVDMIE